MRNDFLRHVIVVVIESEGVFNGETTANVQGTQGWADFFELDVQVDALDQFVPIVGGVVDAGIDEEVKHVQFHVGVVGQVAFVVREYFFVAQPKTGGVEFEFGFFFGGNTEAYLEFWGVGLELFGEEGKLFAVVQHGNDVGPAVVHETGDVLQVLRAFVSVANDKMVFGNLAFVVEGFDQVDIKSAGRFEVDVVFEGLFHDKTEVAALGAITKVVAAFVVDLGHGHVEHPFRPLDVGADFGQIGHFQRCPILLDEFHQGNVVPMEGVVLNVEFVLGPFKGLFD